MGQLGGVDLVVITLAALVSLFAARALPWSVGGQLQIPIAVIFVMAIGPGSIAQDLWRVLDVVIGGVIGIAAVYIYPPRPKPEVLRRNCNFRGTRPSRYSKALVPKVVVHPRYWLAMKFTNTSRLVEHCSRSWRRRWLNLGGWLKVCN